MNKFNKNTYRATSQCHTFLFQILLLGCFILGSVQIFAQQSTSVKYKSGLVISGPLVKIVSNDRVVLKTPHGDTIAIAWDDIAEVKMGEVHSFEKEKKRFPYDSNSYYGTMSVRLSEGEGRWNRVAILPGASLSVGKTLGYKKTMGIGATIGVDGYYNLATTLYPIGLEWRGHITTDSYTPFYQLRSGFTIVEQSGAEGKGGLFVNPSIGIISKRHTNTARYLSLGYNYTSIHEEFTEQIWQQGIWTDVLVSRDRFLHSFRLSVGLYFD